MRKDMQQHLFDEIISHAALSVATLRTKLSKSEGKVCWPVDWPLPTGKYFKSSTNFTIGEYRCRLEVKQLSDSGDLVVMIIASAVQESKSHILFPACIAGSSVTVVNPSDKHKRKTIIFNGRDIIGRDIISSNLSGMSTQSLPMVLDFVSPSGKLTIKTTIKIAPAEREVILNYGHNKLVASPSTASASTTVV
jgi:hypothetical protein